MFGNGQDGAVNSLLDFLDTPRQGAMWAIDQGYHQLGGDPGRKLNRFADVLGAAGMDPDSLLTQGLGLAGDVAVDPLTWAGLGYGALRGGRAALGSLRAGTAAEDAGASLTRFLAEREAAPAAAAAAEAPAPAPALVRALAGEEALPPRPWQMTPEEFGQTGQTLLHGTSRQFDRFDPLAARSRYGGQVARGHEPKFYFTEEPGVAKRFAESGGFKQVDPYHYFDDLDLGPGEVAELQRALDAQVARGKTLAYVDGDGPAEALTRAAKAADVPEDALFDGDVRLYAPGRWPRVVEAPVYGPTLDLAGAAKAAGAPEDLLALLDREGRYRPLERFPNWDHEYSDALPRWMREHGYGKARVRDAAESGFESYLALPEYIGHGQNAHRAVVEDALRRGARVPLPAVEAYPDLAWRRHLPAPPAGGA